MTDLPPSRLVTLQRQQADGFAALRFRPELEPEFRNDRLASLAPRRMVLMLSAAALICSVPLLDATLLHPPETFVPVSRIAQFGFMVPALIIAGIFSAVRLLRRWSEPVLVLTGVVVCAGILYQRHVGASLGFIVPSELVAVVMTGMAVMAGLRTPYFVVAVLAILALSTWTELATFGSSSHTSYVLLSLGMLGLLASIGAALEEHGARAAWLQQKMLEELTLRDPLTGLINARGLREVFERVFATATREHRPVVVCAVDIDHFKAYNDHYGHLAGDDCLRRVAHALSRHGRRGTDIAARTGGEEFVVVWYDVVPDHVVRLLEAMREDVERLGILHVGNPGHPGVVTVSIGAVCAVPGPRLAPEALLKIADEQLYLSKRRGRNCVSLQLSGEDAGAGDALSLRGLRPS